MLDRVLARRIELNEAVGLHKPLIEHRKMQTKALDDEEAKEKNSGSGQCLQGSCFFIILIVLFKFGITRKKMSPTSIGGGGEYHNRR